MVTAQYRWYDMPKQWVPDPFGNSNRKQYRCVDSNLQHDCIFSDVSIDRDTHGAHFGHEDRTLNNQKNITFRNSFMKILPEALLDSYQYVELLNLTGLQIEKIERFALTNGVYIRKLYMDLNVIRELPIFAFRNMRLLNVLVLDRNELVMLPEGIFFGAPDLSALSITNNNLRRINDNTFKKNKRLHYLIMSSNKLTHIDLSLVPSLIHGNVSSNLLTTLSVPEAVILLDASHNRIVTVTGPTNLHLTILRLQHNNLTDVAWLRNYSGLVDVDLSYNELEKIMYIHFKNMHRLERLYLSNNRLIALKLGPSPIRTLQILDVRHNNLLYLEENQEQFDTIEQLYLDHNSIVMVKISSNHMLLNLTLSHNDWDCKNLDELFQNVSESVINDSDRYCKENYQHRQSFCCKESDKPYLDRLIHHISLASVAEKLQRAQGRCSASEALSGVQNLTNFMTQHGGGALLQSSPQRQAELNRLQFVVLQLKYQQLQHEQHLQNMYNEVNNTMRRYRVTKVGLVRPSDNLRKLFEHLNSRRTFKEGETANRLSEANRKIHEVTSLDSENKHLETLLAAKRETLSKIKNDTKGLEMRLKNQISRILMDQGDFFQLTHLNLSRNNIANINNIFKFRNLIELDVSYNELVMLDFVIFAFMKNLKDIKLNNNRLWILDNGIPSPAKSLRSLNLAHNKFLYLDLAVLDTFPALEYINLHGNDLIDMQIGDIEQNFPYLTLISCDNNDWDCINLMHIVTLLERAYVKWSNRNRNCTQPEQHRHICCTSAEHHLREKIVRLTREIYRSRKMIKQLIMENAELRSEVEMQYLPSDGT
ncbi:protein slit-like [Anopheles marshallii]|uniref:protein slit-like n=1 Tax=Anopheles marshallii TaxID=1521116 RepID=UPI00237AFAA0|nr:protein slit-like [Anopheles marshallii]